MRNWFPVAFCCLLISCGTGGSPAAAPKDSAGKTPADYARAYYDATNRDDLAAIQAMYTNGYYQAIVTKRGFLQEPDESLFARHMEQHMHKTRSVTETKSGFFTPPNADGVYSFLAKIEFTDEYKPVFKERTGIDSPHLNDEVCFKLENGIWKITDKLQGY